MSRGVIMSKKGRRAVVMTKDGAFKKVKLRKSANVRVGQEIFSHHLSLPPAHHRQRWFAMAAASLSLIFLFVLSGGAKIPRASAAAYVSFDIQPSIEASIDRHLKIIEVRALNKAAIGLLGSTEKYEHMSLNAFTSEVADKMSKEGYFNGNPELVVTTTVPDSVTPDTKSAILMGISKAIKPLKQKQVFVQGKGEIKTLIATEKNHEKALSEGLSTGRYLIFQQAEKMHPTLTITKAKTLSVQQLDHFHSSGTNIQSTVIENSKSQVPKNVIAQPNPTIKSSHYTIPKTSRPVEQFNRIPVPKEFPKSKNTSDNHQRKGSPGWEKTEDTKQHPKDPNPKKRESQHYQHVSPFLKSPYDPNKNTTNHDKDHIHNTKQHPVQSNDHKMNHGPKKAARSHH